MLPSLQDLPGFFPGIFKRGEGAAAAEQAGRGHGQRQHVDHQNVGRGHHGRDSLRLSPEAQAVENTAEDAEGSGDAVAETEGKSALGQAGGFLRKALETLRHDLGKALKAFGFDSAAVENFTKAFVEPVLDALKDGVNFTAELSFAAFSQVTTVSGGNVSQSTSLVAAEGEETEVPAGELEETLAEVRKQLAEDAVDLQTRLTIYSISTYKNDKGESITKLLLDAQLKITSLENDATTQEEAESLNLVA